MNYRTNNGLTQTFAVNNLNELSSVTRSGTLTVAGTTTSTATNVTVNSTNATLYNDKTFALAGFTVTNGNNNYTAVAQDSSNRKDTNSVVFNLPSTVNYIYDLNGNLTSDSKRGFDYDDENELIRVTVTNSWKSEFTYDGKMRRMIRKEFAWQSNAWVQTNEVCYIYDGNLEIQCRDANNLPILTLTRGRDLSGSLQGAGGIGGLLARTDAANGQTACFHADGNGNVTAIINLQQVIVARYLYDPFGNTLSKAGTKVEANTYRFSSKDYHANSGLYFYGYRWYDPNLQRWLNRDPLAEAGGMNLYGFAFNDAINCVDRNGLDVYELRRTAHNGGGSVDHTFVFIDNTGLTDNKGRPLNFVVNFTDAGEAVIPLPVSLDDYLKSGKQKDPELRISETMETTPEENRKLIDHFKKTSPKQKYNRVFNNCRTTFNRARYFILYDLRNPNFIPDLYFPLY